MAQTDTTLRSRWTKLDNDRSAVVERARDCAALTIPGLLPPAGHSETSRLKTPHQSMGARGANNLSSKLLLILFPPNTPIFREVIDDFTLEQLTQQEGMRSQVEEGLASIERATMTEIESSNCRIVIGEGLKHLIVTGNVLLFMPPEGGMRLFRLDQYVVLRDPMGAVLEIVVKEMVSSALLSEDVRQACGVDSEDEKQKTVALYTRIWREGRRYKVIQEINDKPVPGSDGSYPLDETAWLPLRWTAIPGENYGRGLVEEYLGDLRSLEGLTKAILQAAAAAAKILIMVKPNSTTRKRTIAKAESGDVVDGDANDLSAFQLDKFQDFRVALETAKEITQRLAHAFLLNTSVQRQGERVTAEEIRFMAAELEDALGGTYSVLSQELQLPLVKRVKAQMRRARKLPALPKGVTRTTITTGLEALGRGHDLNKLNLFSQFLVALGPETFQAYVEVGDLIKRAGTALGIDMKGLIKPKEEVEQAQKLQQLLTMLARSAPGVLQELTKQMGAQSQATEQ